MKVFVIIFLASIVYVNSFAQSNLQHQVGYCKSEVERLEKEVDKLKMLLEVQNTELVDLKSLIIKKNREIESLNEEIDKLNSNSEYFLKLAAKLEEAGDYRNAMETYKLLIKCYPSSMESISSRLKVKEMTDKIIADKKEQASKK